MPPSRRGVLLVNLGSPDSPSVPDVRRYLDQFLMDPRVLDSPWPIRRFVVSCFILPKRPKESAHAYSTIWTPEGSPLVVLTRKVRELLAARIANPLAMGMRYGNPSIESGLRELLAAPGGVEEILVMALYPQFAMSSTETAEEEARDAMRRIGSKVPLRFLPPFYKDPAYIEALAESAAPALAGGYDHLLISFHGLPERHMSKADPTGAHCMKSPDCCRVPSPAHATCYRHQAFETARLFVEKAGVPEGKHSISFQSRLGREPWLKPYTDLEIERLAAAGVRRMLVLCPAFVADCLETLEEIGVRARDSFLAAGGESLELIPCMNDHPRWIDALESWSRA